MTTKIIVEGVVVEGDHRGRTLGFPTANLEPAGELPPDGVYAGVVTRADGSQHLAAISIGHRGTFYGQEAVRLLEAHLLDFDADLYGERIVVGVGELVREQSSFGSSAELVAQIATDITHVRALAKASD